MNTFPIVATQLAWAYNYSSSWNWDGAFQGAYGNQQPRNGAILFAGLRDSVSWPDMVIRAVRLWVKFGDAGGYRTKVLSIFGAARNSISGSGDGMRGMGICQVRTATNAWNTSESIYFDSANNTYALEAWRQWLQNTDSVGLVLYLNEAGASSRTYSENYLILTNAGLEIDYEPKGSGGTVTPTEAEIGQTVTLNIDAITSAQEVTHTAEWTLGTASSGAIAIAGGVSQATWTLPSGWLAQLSGAEQGAAACVLTTYEGGEQRGARTIPFTAKVPARYAPEIRSFSVKRYTSVIDDQMQTIYVESLGGNHVWVSLDIEIDRDNGLNPGTAQISYWRESDPETVYVAALSWSNDRLTLTNDRTVIDRVIDLSQGWVFVLTAANDHTSETATARVEAAWAPLHIAGSGYGVGIGMYSDGVAANPRFQVGWPAQLAGGMDGVNNYKADEIGEETETGGHWMGAPIFRTILHTQTGATGYVNLATLASLPDQVVRCYGAITTPDGSVRLLPFASWGSLNWAASVVIARGTGLVQLLLGSSFSGGTNDIWVIVEYTRQV